MDGGMIQEVRREGKSADERGMLGRKERTKNKRKEDIKKS